MSERLDAWRGYQKMLAAVNWATVSATGVEFLRQGMPAKPMRVERIESTMSTRVLWSDGFQEDIDDVDMREGNDGRSERAA